MTRQRIDLNGEWDFSRPAAAPRRGDAQAAGSPPRRVRVPGPWQAQFDDLRDYSGVAWYRHTFDLPAPGTSDVQDPSYILHFGAVDYYTTVWLNGQLIGEHEGGYLPFELTLGDAARRDGLNELVIQVIDPGE